MTHKRINALRAILATTIMLALCAGVLVGLRSLPDHLLSVPFILLGGVVFTLIPASILEWLVHRYIYHRRQAWPLTQIYRIHHQGHHAAIFPTWRYTTSGAVCRHPVTESDISRLYPAGWRNVISKTAHFTFYMSLGALFIWLPAWLLTHNLLFLLSIILTSAVISDLFVRVHDAIHYPGQFKFVEAQPWYGFLDRHHFIHHVDMEANVNFLLPLADWCYGTLRTSLTAAEIAKHGTLEQAKATPIGHSEPAAVFASERKHSRPRSAITDSTT